MAIMCWFRLLQRCLIWDDIFLAKFTHTHTTIVIYDTYNEIKIITLNCNISHTTQNLHKRKSDDGNLHYN